MISQELYDECLRDALAEQQEFIKRFKPSFVAESLGPGWLRHQLMKRNMKVKESIRTIRGEITELHEQVNAKLKQISDLENQCQHSWTEPIYGRGCTNCGKIDTIYIEDCNQVVFHFNKASITDHKIPMWVVKAKGQTYYVDHVTANAPWSTKETPTKGAVKFKNVNLVIDDENCAEITSC